MNYKSNTFIKIKFSHYICINKKQDLKIGKNEILKKLQVARDLYILEYTGGRLHIPTISTLESVGLIKQAKKKGLKVSCSVSINNLSLTDSVLESFDTNYKLMPPLRTAQDIKALKKGLTDGTIDMVTSDHNPIDIENKKIEFDVGVLDADIYGPSIPIMFDIVDERPKSVLIEGKSKMEPVMNYGVKVLSIGFFTKPDQAVIWRGPMASKALNQMIFDANWGELDFLVIDLPPGTGDIHLSILQALPITGAVIVSTPQNVALADAKKGVAMFKQEI